MGRIRDYVKYSRGELENYTKVPDSCVKRINTTTHLEFPPFGLKNFKDSLMQIISQRKIGFYDEHMKGIILDIRNIKILSNFAAVRFDTPGLHIDMRADFYIFQPHVGAKIKGIVKHVSHRQIGVIVYRVFSVKIILQEDVQNNIELNSEVEFRIKDFDLQNVIPFIEGELTNEVDDSTLAPEVSMERDSENEEMSQWPKGGSFLTSTQIPQKSPQKAGTKNYRGSDEESYTNSDDSDNRTMTNNSRTIPMKTEEGSSDDEENSTQRPQYEEITIEKSEVIGADEDSNSSVDKSSSDTVIISTNSCKNAKNASNDATKQENKVSDEESDKNCDEISIGKTEISNVDYPHIPTMNGLPDDIKRTNSPNIFATAGETDSDESISQIGPSQAPQSLTRVRGSGKSSKISGNGKEFQDSFETDKHSPEKEKQKKSRKAPMNLSDEPDKEKVIFSAELDLPHEEQSQSTESSNPLLDFIESVKAEKNPIKSREKTPVIAQEPIGKNSNSKRKRERKLSEMDESLLNIFNKIKRDKRASESDRSDNDSSLFVKPDPKTLPSASSKIRKSKDKANISGSTSTENSVDQSSTVIFQKSGDFSDSDAVTGKKKKSKETTQNSNLTPGTLIKEYVSGSDTDTGRKKQKKKNTQVYDSQPQIVVKEEICISDTDTESKKKKLKNNRTFDSVAETVVKKEADASDTDTGKKKKKKKRDQISDLTAETIVKEEYMLNGLRLRVTPESDISSSSHIKKQKQNSVNSPADHTQNTSVSKKRVSFSLVKEEIEFVSEVPVKKESPTVESVKRRLDLNEINGAGSFSNKHDEKDNVSSTRTQENNDLTLGSNLIKKRKRKHEKDLSSDINHDVTSDNVLEISSGEAPKPKKKKKSSDTSLADSLASILLQAKKNKLNKSLEKESRKSNGNDTSLANASAFSSPGLSSTKLDIKPSK